MEGLLLGALSYYGNNINNTVIEKTSSDLYDSNYENQMTNIEKNQANTLKNKPDYFQQFDSLSFDNSDSTADF